MKPGIVINAGGSIFIREEPDEKLMREFAALLERFDNHKFYIVIGGGRLARQVISHGKRFGADESYLDDMGIDATRLNARILISALGKECCPKPPTGFDEAMDAGRIYEYVVMGGTHPGHTTDAVAAMLAERVGAERLVIATNVDGVYTDDPRTNPDAMKLASVTASELVKITMRGEAGAGSNSVVDPLASKIIKRSRMPTFVVDGRDMEALESALRGMSGRGTVIVHDEDIVAEKGNESVYEKGNESVYENGNESVYEKGNDIEKESVGEEKEEG